MNTRALTYSGAIIAVILAWGYLVYYPYRVKHDEASRERAEAQQTLMELDRFMAQVPTIVSTQKNIESHRIDLNSHLFAKGDIINLFDHLTADAGHFGLRVEEISPPVSELLKLNETMSQAEKPLFINVTLRLSGDYLAFGRFVGLLESEKYFRGFSTCLIHGDVEGRSPLQMTVAFKALLGTAGATS